MRTIVISIIAALLAFGSVARADKECDARLERLQGLMIAGKATHDEHRRLLAECMARDAASARGEKPVAPAPQAPPAPQYAAAPRYTHNPAPRVMNPYSADYRPPAAAPQPVPAQPKTEQRPAGRYSMIYQGGEGPGIVGLDGKYTREVWVYGAHGPLVFILSGKSWPIDGGQIKETSFGGKILKVNATGANTASGNGLTEFVFADHTGAWTRIQIGMIDGFGRLRLCNVRHSSVGPAGWMNDHRAVLTPAVDCNN